MGGRPPTDVIALLAALFVTFALQFFAATALLPALLRLTPAVWRAGFVWQIVTYGFTGYGGPSLWFLLELFILYMFAQDVFLRLGRRRFWTLLLAGVAGAAVAALAAQLALGPVFSDDPLAAPFVLMQGQRILLVILLAAFAIVAGDATIYLFFVLPIQARWFLYLGILFGFFGFLSTKDVGGLAGICAATGVTVAMLRRGGRGGKVRRRWLEWRRRRLEAKVDRLARRRGLRVLDGDKGRGRGPTIN